ncbi:MAG: hypothetical protein ACR2OZ_14970 [Verrucomicrobiales bacterium]
MTTEGAKLHALTVCLNYGDYLQEILRNKTHFDSWTVVTCRSDEHTKEICAAAGLKAVVTEYAGPEGASFDSAFANASGGVKSG